MSEVQFKVVGAQKGAGDVITMLTFDACLTEGEVTEKITYTVNLQPPDPEAKFIPLEDLQHESVTPTQLQRVLVGWVKDTLGKNNVVSEEQIKDELLKRIAGVTAQPVNTPVALNLG